MRNFPEEGQLRRLLPIVVPLLLLGCARRELIRPPKGAEIVEEVLGSLHDESRGLSTLRAFGTLTGSEGGRGYFANFVLLYKKPGLFRLDLTGPFGLAMMNMVSDGETVRAYCPETGELVQGRLGAFLPVDVEPAEIEKLILGTVEPPSDIRRASVFSQRECYVLEGPDGSWEMEVDRGSLRLRRFLKGANEGSPVEVKLEQYRTVGKHPRPFRIEVSQPEEGKRLRIDCTRQIPDEPIEEEAFKLTVPGRD